MDSPFSPKATNPASGREPGLQEECLSKTSAAEKGEPDKMKTRILTLVLALMLVALTPLASLAEETSNVTIWLGSWWEGEKEWIEKEFAEQNPGYTCTIELQPIANYTENAVTAIVGGNSPDVMALDTLFLPTLMSQGLLDPLDDFVAEAGIDMSDITEVLVKAGTMDDTLYAIPYRWTCNVLFYNKTMFDAAGVEHPEDGLTLEQFRTLCEELTIPGEQYGYGIAASKNDPANVMTSFTPVLWGMGGDFLSEDLSTCTLNSPEAIAAIEYWCNLYYDGLVPEGCINYSITADLFPLAMNQTIAMIPMGDSNIVNIAPYAEENGFEWGVCLSPGYARAAGWSFAVPISAANKEGAEVFMKWFLQPEVVSKNNTVLPASAKARTMGKWADELYSIYDTQAAASKHCPNTPAWTQIQTIVTEELQNALQKACTPAEAAEAMVERIEGLL